MGIKDAAIQKRMRVIEKFLQEIASHPLLKNSQIFYDFISIQSEDKFNSKKQAYNTIILPKIAEDIKTLNGEKNISINKEKESFINKIKNISTTNEDVMKKITKEYKNLNLLFQSVISKIKDIKLLWTDLLEKSKSNCEEKIVLGIYDSMAKFMDNWANMHDTQINLINLKLREYFRYIRNEYHSINEFYKSYEDKKNDYKRCYDKILESKDKLPQDRKRIDWKVKNFANKLLFYKDKELTKDKSIPEEETKYFKDKQNLYGCFLNSLIEEYEIISRLNAQRHKDNIISFFLEMSNAMNTFNTALNGILDTIYG